MLHQELINMTHLDSMIDSVYTLHYKKLINTKTLEFMEYNIEALTKGWCNLNKARRKMNKRQAIIPAIAVWILGELFIAPAINLLFGRGTTTSSTNKKWKNYIKDMEQQTTTNTEIM